MAWFCFAISGVVVNAVEFAVVHEKFTDSPGAATLAKPKTRSQSVLTGDCPRCSSRNAHSPAAPTGHQKNHQATAFRKMNILQQQGLLLVSVCCGDGGTSGWDSAIWTRVVRVAIKTQPNHRLLGLVWPRCENNARSAWLCRRCSLRLQYRHQRDRGLCALVPFVARLAQ